MPKYPKIEDKNQEEISNIELYDIASKIINNFLSLTNAQGTIQTINKKGVVSFENNTIKLATFTNTLEELQSQPYLSFNSKLSLDTKLDILFEVCLPKSDHVFGTEGLNVPTESQLKEWKENGQKNNFFISASNNIECYKYEYTAEKQNIFKKDMQQGNFKIYLKENEKEREIQTRDQKATNVVSDNGIIQFRFEYKNDITVNPVFYTKENIEINIYLVAFSIDIN